MTGTQKSSISRDNDSSYVIDFWKTLPAVSIFDISLFRFCQQDVRSRILRILRDGIEEKSKDGEKITLRRALNAQELQKHVNKKMKEIQLKEPIKLTNIYFHLKELEKNKFIKVIATLMEGKHYVSYYGRTAKFFLFSRSEEFETDQECSKAMNQPLVNLISSFNPEMKEKTILRIFNDISENRRERSKSILNWIEKYEQKLLEFEVDIFEIYGFLRDWVIRSPKEVDLYNTLAASLKFEQ